MLPTMIAKASGIASNERKLIRILSIGTDEFP
jgi:hypothetical protein